MDDGLTVEKANYENVPEVVVDGVATREKHAVPTQNAFRSVKRAAESRGIHVNTSKTALMCVSDATTYRACLLYTSPSPRD